MSQAYVEGKDLKGSFLLGHSRDRPEIALPMAFRLETDGHECLKATKERMLVDD